MILGVSCALSEAEVHWRGFLAGLKERGIGIPDRTLPFFQYPQSGTKHCVVDL